MDENRMSTDTVVKMLPIVRRWVARHARSRRLDVDEAISTAYLALWSAYRRKEGRVNYAFLWRVVRGAVLRMKNEIYDPLPEIGVRDEISLRFDINDEHPVIQLLYYGYTYRDITNRLGISSKTIAQVRRNAAKQYLEDQDVGHGGQKF